VKLTTHLDLLRRSRLCSHPLPLLLHGVVLSQLSARTTLSFTVLCSELDSENIHVGDMQPVSHLFMLEILV
jgi:hypothetical protein